MTVNLSQAAAAYAKAAAKAIDPGAAGVAPSGENFGDIMAQALSSAANIGRQSEAVSISAIANQADLNEIVTAVNNAEMTLQTVVAVRDKAIQAYQQIMRMPI
jgi:flagellar hook-basal body complex protein FliE